MKIDLKNTTEITLDELEKLNDYELTTFDKISIIFENIILFFKSIPIGIKNFIFYFKTIYQDRFWDHYFFEKLINTKLKQMEKNWVKNTHYIGDNFTKKRIQVLLRMQEKINTLENDCKDKEAHELRKKFYHYLGNNMERFWD